MAISLVQAKSATGTTSPVTVTLTSATTAGNCLVVCVGEGNSTTNPTVSGMTLGGAADHFAVAVALAVNADTNVEIWTDQNCAGGQTAVAVSFNAGSGTGNGYTVWVFEFSGVVSTAAVDKTNSAGASSGAWSSGSTGTLTQANEVGIGVGAAVGSVGAPTLTGPSSPWSNQAQVSAAKTAMIAGTQIVSATTALTYSGTTTTGKVGAAIITLLGQAGTVVNLPVAQVTVAAPAPAPAVVVPLPVAQVTVAAPAPAPVVRPALPVAQVRVAAPAPVLPVFLPPAQVTISARPVAPGVVVFLPLAVARVTVAALPPAPSRQLLVSLASASGTDDYGNAFPQGIFASAGVIQGPEFVGNDFVLNTSGFFLYSATPAAGNLIQSIAPAAGIDGFGNNYVQGAASYQAGLASAVTAGAFTTYAGSLALGWTAKAVIETNSSGDLVLLASSGRQVITGNNILDGGAGGATFQADVSVNGVNLNVGNGTNAKVNLNPPMASPPGWPTSGTTLANTQTCLDAVVQSLKNRGLMA